jgi:hypothetical protein
LPGSHEVEKSVQASAVGPEKLPGAQAVQALAPPAEDEKVPGAHGEHFAADATVVAEAMKVPPGQSAHVTSDVAVPGSEK